MKTKFKPIIVVALFIYVFWGIFVIFENSIAGLLYFTVFPFHIFLLKRTIERKQIVFSFFNFLLMFSHGIHSFTFFLKQDLYDSTGFNAIGNFDFSLGYYIRVYVYVFVFMLGVNLVSTYSYMKNRSTTNMLYQVMYDSLNSRFGGIKRSSKYNRLSVVVCMFSCLLAVFMYSHQIGITGMNTTRLPFHLSGILYYFRKYVVVGLMLLCYVKSSNRRNAYWSVCIYAVIGGMAFASKGLAAFVLFPVALIELFSGNKKKAFLTILYFLVLYEFLSSAKYLLYLSPTIDKPYFVYAAQVVQNSSLDSVDFLVTLDSFSGRLFGMQSSVLAYQHMNFSPLNFISFYLGKSIGAIVPDMAALMFGLHFKSNFSFGVAIGYIATAIYLSGGSIILIFVQAIFFGWILFINERSICKCIRMFGSNLHIWIVMGLSLIGVASVWFIPSLLLLYAATVLDHLFLKLNISSIKIGGLRLGMTSGADVMGRY